MHFYAWENGLKTGMYYLRSKPASQSKKITIEERDGEEKLKILIYRTIIGKI